MIIIFHSLYFVFKFALKWYRNHVAQAALQESIDHASKEEMEVEGACKMMMPLDPEECFVFATPVYRQRYSAVQDVLLDPRWRQEMMCVADFGCAEFGLFQYMKHLTDVRHVLEVDIDEQVLTENKFKVMPLTADYLKQRSGQLVVEILIGSIADPDWRLKKVDAIIGIEIIEHLFPDTLDALPYNVFGYAKPKVAVFTTPNADFNVLFPNFSGFRHDDHKFEWTRQQFEDWGNNIVSRFPDYSVTFSGIGKGPAGTESLGCCSQMAVFVREYKVVSSEVPEHAPASNSNVPDESFGVCTHLSYSQAQRLLLEPDLFQLGDIVAAKYCDNVKPDGNQYYKTLQVIEYPFVEDKRTSSEKLLHEAIYQIHQHAYVSSRYYQQETGCVEIPLYEIVRNFQSQFVTEMEIRDLLTAAKYTIVECVLNGSGERCMCVRYNIHMDDSPSKEESDYETSEHEEDVDEQPECVNSREDALLQHNFNTNESDWDLVESQEQNGATKDEVATPSDPLVDSGYQKSLSNAEWSPQSPIDLHFEDQFTVTKVDVNDLKDSIRARLEQSRNGKYMNNRLFSEWRRISGAAAAISTNMTSPTAAGTTKTKGPVASTSNLPSKRRKKSHSKKSDLEESDSAKEDVKCIANELMYNSLNKLDIDEDAHIIPAEAAERPNDLEIPQFIVENGDLANNNRDNEGNNYPEIDDIVVNVAEIVDGEVGVMEPDPNENLNVPPNQNQDQENRNIVRIHPLVEYIAPDERGVQEIADVPPVGRDAEVQACNIVNGGDIVEDAGLNYASREALFDPASQVHMDDVDSITDEYRDVETDVDTIDIIDVENIDESSMSLANDPEIPDNNPFPHWLLQLFAGSYVAEEHAGTDDVDEAHFYCQGDGLGVHPSIVEVDIDTSSSSSSSDAAQAERTISEDEVGSLVADLAAVPPEPIALEVVGRMLDLPVLVQPRMSNTSNESGDEFFDTIDDSSGVPRGPQCPSNNSNASQ